MGGIDVADNCKSSIPDRAECVRSTGWKLGYSRYARYVYCMIVLIDFRPFQHYRIPVRSRSNVTSSWNCNSPPPSLSSPRCSHSDVLSRYDRNNRGGKQRRFDRGAFQIRFKIHLNPFIYLERKRRRRMIWKLSERKFVGKCCFEVQRRIVFRFGNFVSKRGRKEKNSRMESQLYDRANIKYSSRCRMYELIFS